MGEDTKQTQEVLAKQHTDSHGNETSGESQVQLPSMQGQSMTAWLRQAKVKKTQPRFKSSKKHHKNSASALQEPKNPKKLTRSISGELTKIQTKKDALKTEFESQISEIEKRNKGSLKKNSELQKTLETLREVNKHETQEEISTESHEKMTEFLEQLRAQHKTQKQEDARVKETIQTLKADFENQADQLEQEERMLLLQKYDPTFAQSLEARAFLKALKASEQHKDTQKRDSLSESSLERQLTVLDSSQLQEEANDTLIEFSKKLEKISKKLKLRQAQQKARETELDEIAQQQSLISNHQSQKEQELAEKEATLVRQEAELKTQAEALARAHLELERQTAEFEKNCSKFTANFVPVHSRETQTQTPPPEALPQGAPKRSNSLFEKQKRRFEKGR